MDILSFNTKDLLVYIDRNTCNEVSQFEHSRKCIELSLRKYLINEEQISYVLKKNKKKPYIELQDGRKLGLSISHSENMSAIAIYPYENLVGIDIEVINPKIYPNLSKYVIGHDQLALNELSIVESTKFYLAWTVKEALVKAYPDQLLAYKQMMLKEVSCETEKSFKTKFLHFENYLARTFLEDQYIVSIVEAA